MSFVIVFVFMALDSFYVDASLPSLVVPDGDRPDDTLGLRACEINRQQTVPQIRTLHLDPVRQHEHPLELTRRDTAVEVLPGLVILLPAADHQLVLLDRNI